MNSYSGRHAFRKLLLNNLRLKGKRKTQNPCPICFLHRDRCICEFIPRLNLKTKITLLIHAKELKRTTNTGRLATHALVNSEILIRGLKDQPLDFAAILDPAYRTVLLFPSEDAQELSMSFVSESTLPLQILVPDGNWRQASKVQTRHPELSHLPRVMFKALNLDTQHLRAESSPEGMSTLAAIAHALGITEGPEVRDRLLALYRRKLEQTLRGRGIPEDKV